MSERYLVVGLARSGVAACEAILRMWPGAEVLATDSREITVDAAPSDAIALALRAKAPIYADATVLDKAGIVSGR